MNVVLTFVATLSVQSCFAQIEGSVKNYSKDDFLVQLEQKNNFVMFFAPWCSHCKRLTPVWEDLAKDFNTNDKSNLAIAKVDCTIHTELCSNQDITGYPSLKLYKMGESDGKKFKGSRDLPSLKKFIFDELENVGDVFEEGRSGEPIVLIDLTDDTFENHVSEGNHFVKFFAPWCSHCQNLAPTWHELAETLKENKDITVGKIDCTKSQKVCSEFDVTSYPTLLWLQNGKKIDIYQGARSLNDLIEYVAKMLTPTDATKTESVKTPVDGGKSVLSLNDKNFQQHVENGFTFVKFFAPWCGHCKRLAPTWEELAQKLSAEGKIKIAHVDCTLEENKELCNDQEVEGYPTLFLYRSGTKIAEYSGSRVLDDLTEFVKRQSSHDEL